MITPRSCIYRLYVKKLNLPIDLPPGTVPFIMLGIIEEFVWNPEQIEVLFDSLMRDYPIGSFLFWAVSKEHTKDYEFYEFIREYSELDARHNPKANINANIRTRINLIPIYFFIFIS